MPATNQGWPEAFGFQISGCGPCYILAVEEGSSAHAAGLQPGDQILEIEGHNVSMLPSEALVNLARECVDVPPSIGVVSRTQQVDVLPDALGNFGFSLMRDGPLQVETVNPESPASDSGIRPGDYVLEVNGVPVKHHEAAQRMIAASCNGTLRLGLLCISRRQKRSRNSTVREYVQSTEAVHQERRSKAQEFNKKVDEILGDQPEVKEKVFTVLKQYAAERRVEYLAYALPMILSQEPQQPLIDNIRIRNLHRLRSRDSGGLFFNTLETTENMSSCPSTSVSDLPLSQKWEDWAKGELNTWEG